MIKGLTEGRIVHFIVSEKKRRAAIVVEAFGNNNPEGRCNLQIFLDGSNDRNIISEVRKTGVDPLSYIEDGSLWIPSVAYSETGEIGTWTFPKREE